jgi:hypothetical protein
MVSDRRVEVSRSEEELDTALTLVDAAIRDTEELSYLASAALRQHADVLAQSDADASVIDAASRVAIK